MLFIEGHDVVCEFHLSEWKNETSDKLSKLYEFRSYNVPDIVSNKKIGSWTKNHWKLLQIGPDRYQFRKHVKDFNDDFLSKNKYLFNKETWLSPVSEVKTEIDHLGQGNLPKPKPYEISENGNAVFTYQSKDNAQKVILSASFNHWNTEEIKMKKTAKGWEIRLDLPPGIYEYKFIEDGAWIHDKNNPYTVENEHGTLNSILLIGEKFTFNLEGHTEAKKVMLAGSFNNWNEVSGFMQKTPTGWKLSVPLPPGKHFYKFIVDGKWINDPTNKLSERDRVGNVNSVVLVH